MSWKIGVVRRGWVSALAAMGIFWASPAAAEQEQASEEVVDGEALGAAGDDEGSRGELSEHGSYEWKRSWGIGVELGFFPTPLDRWDEYLLKVNDQPTLDTAGAWHADFSAEAAYLEGVRLEIFGGVATPFHGDPSLLAVYGGVAPGFTVRRDAWEMALGGQVGVGVVDLELDEGASADAGLVVVRPFVEVRRHLSERVAVYGRGGFSAWVPFNVSTDGLFFGFSPADPGEADDLQEGGVFFALGARFGDFPEHVKVVPDSDGDGLRDDVDGCAEEAEDVDGFEDEDGCPDPDNDGDGVLDDEDECPAEAEDADGWRDEDGCPEQDDDRDGDEILDTADACPERAEDRDSFEDEDGCPDLDNDADGIEDELDECPGRAGYAAQAGCPFERIEVLDDRIVLSEPIEFGEDMAVAAGSLGLLGELAVVVGEVGEGVVVEVYGEPARAQSVYTYLLENGVEPGSLAVAGDDEAEGQVVFRLKRSGAVSGEDASGVQ